MDSGAYLLDSSPGVFSRLLDYLRNGRLVLEPGVTAEDVAAEARHFGLADLEAAAAAAASDPRKAGTSVKGAAVLDGEEEEGGWVCLAAGGICENTG